MEALHLAEIRPRPGFESAHLSQPPGPEYPATLQIRYVNLGGAATAWVVVLHAATFFFFHRNACAAHYTTPPSAVTELKSVASGLPVNTAGGRRDRRFLRRRRGGCRLGPAHRTAHDSAVG